MSRRGAHPWWMPLAAGATAALILALGRTWRIRYRGVHEYDQVLARGQRCIYAFWHARMLPLVYTHRRRGIAVLVSQHRDGEWIARVIGHLGFPTARGSSTRGGEQGARELLAFGERGHLLAITPDGPRGPAERAKSGVVYAASRTGFPIVPVATATNHAWRFRSWDELRLPKPFARVVVAYGDPIAVPPDLERDEVRAWRGRIDEAIRDLTRSVAAEAEEAAERGAPATEPRA